ncbi:MAG: DNA polymerase IV [Chitinophagaceae bacterium]|nr:MAG: DNA polymerase IV [Chitinophagaceae bacterium]
MERTIVHIDLDAFFVSVERLKDPGLNNKPVIVGGGKRGVVASCSYEARKFGVHSAMPVQRAVSLCPEAILVSGNSSDYSYYSNVITEIIDEKAPLYQKSSIDEFYLDLTGMDKVIGAYKWATELRKEIIKKTGLPISFGMSINKMVAKITTGFAKPNGQKHVERADVQDFLDPLVVKKIPGIGEKTTFALNALDIFTIKDLRNTPESLLVNHFGNQGYFLLKKARGEDNSPVIQHNERKSISTESTFEEDSRDLKKMEVYLTAMVLKLCYRLRKKGLYPETLTVKVRYADFSTFSKQTKIDRLIDERSLTPLAKKLFYMLYDKKSLIRLIGVRLGDLNNNAVQLGLFDEQNNTTQYDNLTKSMDKIREKYGESTITKASAFHKK